MVKDKLSDMLKELNESKKAVNVANAEFQQIEREQTEALASVNQQLRKLEKEKDEICKPFQQRFALVRKKKEELERQEISATRAYFLEAFKTCPPENFATFKEYVSRASSSLLDGHDVSIRKELKPQPIPGLLIFAGRDGDYGEEARDYPGAERFYAAWNQKTKLLVGWLHVEPSKHPGDQTSAIGEVDGKPLWEDSARSRYGSRYDKFVSAPLATWRGKLRQL